MGHLLVATESNWLKMVLNKLHVPELRQMALVKIAIAICNDKEIRAVVKEYGITSFVFLSKETHIFLRKPPTSVSEEVNQLRINECQSRVLVRCKTSLNAEVHMKPEGSCSDELRIPLDILPSKKWEDLVQNKISTTSLPRYVRNELFSVVRIITFEIDNWVKDHSDILSSCAELQCSLQWKPQGKIDRKKTAKVLIWNDSLSLTDRYSLSCLYYLEGESYYLWSRMCPGEKKVSWAHTRFLPFWFVNDWMLREGSKSVYTVADIHTPILLRQTFSEFFTQRKLKYLLNSIFWKTMEYEDLILTLSEIDASNREDIFKTCAAQVLEYFLDWPLQNEFIEVADFLWPYLSETNFRYLLELILYRRIMVGWVDYDYIDLLKEFWSRSPPPHKEYIKQNCIYEPLMFAVNHNSIEPFPNEKLLENYKEEYLMFKFQGVKYCMFKSPRTFDRGIHWRSNTHFEFNRGCKRAHGILFSNVEKRKFKQLEQNE